MLAVSLIPRAETYKRLSPIAAAESMILHFLVRALDAELLTGGTGFHDCALIFFKASSMCGGINFLPDSSAFSCFCSLTICCAV